MGEPASEDHMKRVERELAKEDSLLANMLEQAPGMLGMAFMFIITIAMGVWLQPWFNAAGLQAFGESGATQARWIMLELVAIFAFTFVILWLAKRHLQHIIKYGLLFVLFLALCYTTVPGAHILLVPEIETEAFEFTGDNVIDEEIVSLNSDGSMITQIVNWTDNVTTHNFVISKRSADTSLEWQHNLDAFPGPPMITVMEGEYAYTATNGQWIWSFDKENGDILSKYACFGTAAGEDLSSWNESLEDIGPITGLEGGCVTALEVIEFPNADFTMAKGALYITTGANELVRLNTFNGTDNPTYENTSFARFQAKWSYPQLQLNEGHLQIKQYDENSILLVSREGAAMILLEEFADSGLEDEMRIDSSELEWYYDSGDENNITAFNIVASPWGNGELLAMIGHDTGLIKAFIIDDDGDDEDGGDGIFEEEKKWKGDNSFKGPINAINSFDLDNDSGNELWIADADGIHGLFYSSLIEYATFDIVVDEESQLSAEGWNIQVINTGVIDEIMMEYSMQIQNGEFDPDTMYNSYGIQWSDTAFLTGLIIAVILMAALIIRPEWYVVNTVGVLVGAGVIVMLGVTFVPTLIVIFMILAAIYDAWAVYRSKHMLDLADTMIGLNLPILLVAPQGSGYSMLKEKDSIRPPEAAQDNGDTVNAPTTIKKRKKPQEAMFMGLGDVIFPGMLVVSCVDSIPTGGLAVGISALIGGLVGYFVLMGYVASGRPQAGLPLLNGGAILGYIIGGLIFVGSAAFSFGISF
jgi:presenilin-like A22 family membrane protease